MCSEVINKITQEPNQRTDVGWTPTRMAGKLLPFAAALGFHQGREISSFVPGSLNKIDMDIEATLNELLAQETEEGMAMEFNDDELLGDHRFLQQQ